jgi:C-terminal processing protease CtpA/Prc
MRTHRNVLAVYLVWLAGACSSAEPVNAIVRSNDTCATLGESVCQGDRVVTCELRSQGKVQVETTTCGAEQTCRQGACVDPTDRQRARAKALSEMVTQMQRETALDTMLDYDRIRTEGGLGILKGSDDDLTYLSATWKAFQSIPQGHQGMSLTKGCGTLLPYQSSSRYGVCAQARGEDAIVTVASAGNSPGLTLGDRIVAVDGVRGAAMFDALANKPVCGGSAPSEANRKAAAAASMFGTLSEGASLEVVSASGATRSLQLGPQDKRTISCAEPLGRPVNVVAEARRLPDGTAVIRIPSFVPFDEAFPTDSALIEAYIQRFIARIQVAFDTVKDAPRMIWDIRGNGGGFTLAGIAIASGMPGARPGEQTYCSSRISGSNPPAFQGRYAAYELVPGGAFAYAGKVAVLIDGHNYSAADYFPYLVRNGTSALLVGSPTAGAFGASSGTFTIAESPALNFTYDVNRCVDSKGTALEGRSVEPHVSVTYEPSDLASGRDTVLDTAVRELSK